MKGDFRFSTPWILIIIGIWYLFANLGLIRITPWRALILYWPIILIWYGIKNFIASFKKGAEPFYMNTSTQFFWFGTMVVGIYMLLPRVGFTVPPISWNLVWPVIIIVIGISYLFKDRFIYKIIHTDDNRSSDKYQSHSSIIGDFNRGGSGWVVEDTNLGFGVGDVKFDLTKAIIPDRHIKMNISGIVGDIVIYLPQDLPFKTICHTKIGDVSVLHENKSGTGNVISLETPDYAIANRKLDINIQLKIGSVKIRRIG